MPPIKDWPHAPVHRISSDGIYMVTGATLHKERLFNSDGRLTMLEGELLSLSKQYQWQLEAWSVFVNHYHIITRDYGGDDSLKKYLKHLHANTARELNKRMARQAVRFGTTIGTRN